ncbi:MAG TPA: hypothetical protein PKC21_02810 [Oligoflexia bacterium]|nr:hypothetical protein [Oligoflexia bacterium]HMR24263.1 hypothetical protein [Oligoflexia bacterium]
MRQVLVIFISLIFSSYNTLKASNPTLYELKAALEKFEIKYNPSNPNDFKFRKSHVNRLDFKLSWAPISDTKFMALENSYLITGKYRIHFVTDLKYLSESLYNLNYQQYKSLVNNLPTDYGIILLTQFFLNGWQSNFPNFYEQCEQKRTVQCIETINNLISISTIWKQYLNLDSISAYNDNFEEVSQTIDQWIGTERYSIFRYIFP